jgi:hypothetical protein
LTFCAVRCTWPWHAQVHTDRNVVLCIARRGRHGGRKALGFDPRGSRLADAAAGASLASLFLTCMTRKTTLPRCRRCHDELICLRGRCACACASARMCCSAWLSFLARNLSWRVQKFAQTSLFFSSSSSSSSSTSSSLSSSSVYTCRCVCARPPAEEALKNKIIQFEIHFISLRLGTRAYVQDTLTCGVKRGLKRI